MSRKGAVGKKRKITLIYWVFFKHCIIYFNNIMVSLGIILILLEAILLNFWHVLSNIFNHSFKVRLNRANYLFQNIWLTLENTLNWGSTHAKLVFFWKNMDMVSISTAIRNCSIWSFWNLLSSTIKILFCLEA